MAGVALTTVTAMTMLGTVATAQSSDGVELGTADSFAVLAGQAISNTGPSMIYGDLGLSPGTTAGTGVSGFPPGLVIEPGTQHVTNAVALQAQSDLTTAYDDAAGRAITATVSGDLGGQTLSAGTYFSGSSMSLTGPEPLFLDAGDDPDAVFIFQIGSGLTTGPSSSVELSELANPCNVFWQVGSSATLDTATTFVGTIMALTSITVATGATVEGRVLARNGSVTLDNNTIDASQCAPPTTTTPPTTPPTSEPTDTTEPTTPTTTETTDPDDSTTPTTTEPDDSTTPTTTETTEPTTSVPPTSVPTTPPTAVPNGSSVIPLLPLLLPATLIGGSVAAAPVVGPMIGQSLGDLGFPLPALPEFPPLAGSAMPGPGPVQPVAPAPMAPGPESPNGRGGEPGAMGDVTGPVAADTGGTAVLMTGSMGDFELPLPSGVRLPPLPFIR